METPEQPIERVGFRDIYNAVGESEKRIKEHISLILLPFTTTLADHEKRLRSIEEQGSDEARAALKAAEAVDARLTVVEAWKEGIKNAGDERRRIGDLSKRTIIAIMVASQFILGFVIAIANLLTQH